MGKYVHLLEGKENYPFLVDSNNQIMSLPPIINGSVSAMSKDTKNVLIDVTGTDEARVEIVLNALVSNFSECCKNKFEIKSVLIKDPTTQISEFYTPVIVLDTRIKDH